MKPKKLKYLLTEETEDIFQFITEPESQFTDKHKKAFLENVKKFNQLSKSVYREISLQEITKQIKTLGKVAERVIMTENDDWFDQISLKRDAKLLNESVALFEKTAKEIYGLQSRLESAFDDIGAKLSKYFEIEECNEEATITEKNNTKFRKGDKVRTREGKIETVERINSNGNIETKENDYSWPPETLTKI